MKRKKQLAVALRRLQRHHQQGDGKAEDDVAESLQSGDLVGPVSELDRMRHEAILKAAEAQVC